jgi:beta-glucosidase
MQSSLASVARPLAVIAALAVACCPAQAQVAPAAQAVPARPWADASLSSAARAEMLLTAMTLEEKLALVYTFFPPFAKGGGAPSDLIPSAGHQPAIPRLGIPALRETDASLGVANQVEQRKGDVATALPSGLALAAR